MNRRMFAKAMVGFLGFFGLTKTINAEETNPDHLPVLEFDDYGRVSNREKLMEGIPFTLDGEYFKGEWCHQRQWQRKRRVWTNDCIAVGLATPTHRKGEAELVESLGVHVNNPEFPAMGYEIRFSDDNKGIKLRPCSGNASCIETHKHYETIRGIASSVSS